MQLQLLLATILLAVPSQVLSQRAACTSENALRLVNVRGLNPREGKVEVCRNGFWGDVCYTSWDYRDAAVVCRQLGFSPYGAVALQGRIFNLGLGGIVLINVICDGTENSLTSCLFNVPPAFCRHNNNAGVRCQEQTSRNCTENSVRLANGATDREGRVEVCINGGWGTITSDSWDYRDARVICRQLGYSSLGAVAENRAAFGQGIGAIVLDNVNCQGNEESIADCPSSVPNVDFHSEDVGVRCQLSSFTPQCIENAVRLVGGVSSLEGRVEICVNGDWGTVIHSSWDYRDASVVCRQLNHSPFGAEDVDSGFGGGTGAIVLDFVGCTGSELTLATCAASVPNYRSHSQDAGVRCKPNNFLRNCAENSIRLFGGTSSLEGRVEVCVNGDWGTVVSSGWDYRDASVVCRQLNHSPLGAVDIDSFGGGTGAIVLTGMSCAGTETTLTSCRSSVPNFASHSGDAGVRCHPSTFMRSCDEGSIRLVGGMSQLEGRVEVCVNGDWGRVRSNSWDYRDASVVCRQLENFSSLGAVDFDGAVFGQGSGAIVLRSVSCQGTESRLTSCSSSIPGHLSNTANIDAGVRCQPESFQRTCEENSLQLVGGTNRREGRVEMCVNGDWGTVAHSGWDQREASVVCRQLGFSPLGAVVLYSAAFGPGSGAVVRDSVTCLGTEESLDRCSLYIFGSSAHSQDVSVRCLPADVTLTPSHGNQLGGTPVLVEGFRLESNNFIRCAFDGIASFGTYVDDRTALCVTPVMNTQGIVNVEVTVISGTSRDTSSAVFTTLSPIRAYSVEFSVISSNEMELYFKAGEVIKLSWLPEEVLPSEVISNSNDVLVDIHLLQFRDRPLSRTIRNRSPWIEIHSILGVPNSGSFEFQIPDDVPIANCLGQNEACPVAFRVSAGPGTEVNIVDAGEVALPENSAGIWSAVGYLQASKATASSLSDICNMWNQPSNRILTSRLQQLPACPPLERQVVLDARFRLETSQSIVTRLTSRYEEGSRRFYAPLASTCYVLIVMEGSPSDTAHQCCYNGEGILVVGQGGGSIDKVSPLTRFTDHIMEDLLPYAFCCHGGMKCDIYEDLRPSKLTDEPPYVLPIPACVYGDPHLVTLDGHRYTFNGKGEFTLVETHDNIITVQGRMEQAVDSSGNTAPGTVFTSIVAHQAGDVERTVEFQVNQQGGLDILVDQERVDFTDLQEQSFQQVVVIDEGNQTGVAEFSEGANIRIQVANDIISVMLITLPDKYRSLTRGLMGNFNGNKNDDFIPKGSTASISVESTAEEIFSFGNTWAISATESFFAYNRPGEGFASFLDPDFTPAFEPEFDDPELQQRADEICGGDQACLFDVAATKNEEIGKATMIGVMDFEMIVESAEPIECDPPCDQGVCVATNNCSCAMDYSGPRCTQRVERECDTNMCQNNGTCVQHARSITCKCPEGFIGVFCQEKEPPLSLRLINSSPRINGRTIALDFIPSKLLSSARCILFNHTEENCLSGRAQFPDLMPGSYVLDIEAETAAGERVVETRTVFVCDGEAGLCGVNLINEGVTVSGDCVRIQFTGCFFCNSYACRLDGGSSVPCRSPVRYCELDLGSHEFQVIPTGTECNESERLSRTFTVV